MPTLIPAAEMPNYVGRRVRVLSTCNDWLIGSQEPPRETIIIGVSPPYFVVYKPLQYGGYEQTDDNHKKLFEGWRVVQEHLKFLPNLPLPKPYPHKCKLCKSPARKCESFVFCSNARCKSRVAFKKALPKPAVITYSVVDKEGFVLCETCGGRLRTITMVEIDEPPAYTKRDTYRSNCDNGHYTMHTWKNGERLEQLNPYDKTVGWRYTWHGSGFNRDY
jgi:hypothetical protein